MDTSAILTLIGGLAVFIYGMKLMSESLQYVAGEKLRSFLASMTRNRMSAVFSGLMITTAIQSSSATTVLVVGFVNAGLIQLTQAIGVIMGANIGTTITAWVVSILGFKVQIAYLALPSVALGIVLSFTNRDRLIGWGNFFVGFGFLFLGLEYLKNSVPDSAKNPETFQFFAQYTNMGFLTVLLFVAIGSILTIVIQSSSASTTITITLAYSGVIPLDAAYGMILGENIGTTITANLAAIPGNPNAKKAALAHTVFNLIGVVWALALFQPFYNFIDALVPGDPLADVKSTRFHISAFHTIFNVTNTLILVWFIPQITSLVNAIVNSLTNKKTSTQSEFLLLTAGSIRTTDLSILELSDYTRKVIQDTRQLFDIIKQLILFGYDNKKVAIIFAKEQELDSLRMQILRFLNQLQESGVTGSYAKSILGIMERIQAAEEIGDNFARIARRLRKASKENVTFDKSLLADLRNEVNLIEEHYDLLCSHLEKIDQMDSASATATRSHSQSLRERVIQLQRKMNSKVKKKKYQQKVQFLPVLYFRDVSRSLDEISRQLNTAIYADS